MSKKPWYKNGLRFSCTQCGKCCTGPSGYVWVTQEEIENMARDLQISVPEFVRAYTREVNGKISLKEFPKTFDCVFLRDKKCMVYQSRPKQCRTFPFWEENLESKTAWEESAKYCEGINHEHAPLISIKHIKKWQEE